MSRTATIIMLALCLVVPGLSFSQQGQGMDFSAVRMQDVVGTFVSNEAGTFRGSINDFVLTPANGEVTFMVVQEAINDTLSTYLVPINALKVTGNKLIITLSRPDFDKLQTMPGENLPESIAQGSPAPVLGSKLDSFSVVDQSGQDVGKVAGAMLNLTDGKINYLAIAPSSQLGLSEALYSLPNGDISQVSSSNKRIMLSIGMDRFENLKGFSRNSWPSQAGG